MIGNSQRMTIERLNAATDAERADLLRGFEDGWTGAPPPDMTSDFYEHGRQQALSDKNKDIDRDQRRLAWEHLRLGRSSTEREWADECLRRGDIEGYTQAQERHTAAVFAELGLPVPTVPPRSR